MRVLAKIGVAAVAALAISDCLDPTEIEVLVSTDVACSSVNSTAIAVGPPGDDTRSVTAKTTGCSPDGGIGMLVVTPSDGVGDAVGIRVTLGVGATGADTCVSPNFDGCIVARRSLRYVPHTRLVLPVELEQDCLNRHCDQFTTCISGQCVDAGIPACSDTNTCEIDAGPPPTPDGSACDLPATLIVPTPVAVTPHLVKMQTGYAIGYETASINDTQRNYVVVRVSPTGVAGKPVQLNGEPLAAGSSVGPLGTDGTNFATTYINAAGIAARAIDPTGKQIGELVTQPGAFHTARAGMLYEPNGSFYAYMYRSVGLATFAAWVPNNTGSANTIPQPNVDDFALAHYNGVYYGAFHDGNGCYVQQAAIGPGVFSAGAENGWSSLCSTVRFAENAPGVSLYFRAQQTSTAAYLLQISRTTVAPNLGVDPVNTEAIVALPGTGNILRAVYAGSLGLRDLEVDTTLTVVTKEDVVAGWTFAGDGIGFDAVAEPNSLTHTIAFYSATPPNPGIYLQRICH